MEDLIERISRFKAAVDHGFSRVGPSLTSSQPLEEALLASANRIIRLSNAAVLLCKNGHANESVELLTSLVSTAWTMSWISLPAHRKKAPAESVKPLQGLDWTQLHQASDGQKLFRAAGLDGAALENLSRELHEQTALSKQMNNASIPWAHVFGKADAGADPKDVLTIVGRSMEQAIKALDSYWPGMFPAPEER